MGYGCKINMNSIEGKSDMKMLWLFLRPNRAKIVFLLIMAMIATIVITSHDATSKVSWLENRGIPFSFVSISGYEGPCLQNSPCRIIRIESFNPIAFLFDISFLYVISSLMYSVYEMLKNRHGGVFDGT